MAEQGANAGHTDRFTPDGPIHRAGAVGFTAAAKEGEPYPAGPLPRNDGRYGEADCGEPVGAVLRALLRFHVGRIVRAQRMAHVFMRVPSERIRRVGAFPGYEQRLTRALGPGSPGLVAAGASLRWCGK